MEKLLERGISVSSVIACLANLLDFALMTQLIEAEHWKPLTHPYLYTELGLPHTY